MLDRVEAVSFISLSVTSHLVLPSHVEHLTGHKGQVCMKILEPFLLDRSDPVYIIDYGLY